MASLFPTDMSLLPSPTVGASQYRSMQDADQMRRDAMAQQQLQLQQQRLGLEETQANVPLRNLERQVAMGGAQGALARQPFELSRQQELARGAAGRVGLDNQNLDLAAQQNVQLHQMQEAARQADIFVQAFGPMLEATAAGNFQEANDGWNSAFELLEKHKVPGIEQLKVMPREQVLPAIRQRYTQAVNTAPVIRKHIEDALAHKRAMDLEKERSRSRERVATTRTASDRPVNTTDAAGARLLEQYNKDPSKLTAANRETLRIHLENQIIRLDPDMTDRWEDNAYRMARIERDERARSGSPLPPAEFVEKLSSYTQLFRDQHMKNVLGRAYPMLYPQRTPNPNPNAVTRPQAGAAVDFNQLPPRR